MTEVFVEHPLALPGSAICAYMINKIFVVLAHIFNKDLNPCFQFVPQLGVIQKEP